MKKEIPYGNCRTLVEYFHENYHHALLAYSISIAVRFNSPVMRGEDHLQRFYMKVILKEEMIKRGYLKNGFAYLSKIIHNDAINEKRERQARRNREDICACMKATFSRADAASQKVQQEELLRMIESRLTETEYAILRHYVDGYTGREIGEMLGMPSATVGTKVHRIKKKLCKFLRGMGLTVSGK